MIEEKASREAEILGELHHLENLATCLQERMGKLESRLESVIRPTSPSAAMAEKEPERSTPMGQILFRVNRSLEIIERMIVDLLARLEI